MKIVVPENFDSQYSKNFLRIRFFAILLKIGTHPDYLKISLLYFRISIRYIKILKNYFFFIFHFFLELHKNGYLGVLEVTDAEFDNIVIKMKVISDKNEKRFNILIRKEYQIKNSNQMSKIW